MEAMNILAMMLEEFNYDGYTLLENLDWLNYAKSHPGTIV